VLRICRGGCFDNRSSPRHLRASGRETIVVALSAFIRSLARERESHPILSYPRLFYKTRFADRDARCSYLHRIVRLLRFSLSRRKRRAHAFRSRRRVKSSPSRARYLRSRACARERTPRTASRDTYVRTIHKYTYTNTSYDIHATYVHIYSRVSVSVVCIPCVPQCRWFAVCASNEITGERRGPRCGVNTLPQCARR